MEKYRLITNDTGRRWNSRRLAGQRPFKSPPARRWTSHWLHPRRSRGFTLLEMILVMAIFALAVSMVAPSITSGLKSAELRATCRKAGALMRRARNNAVTFKRTMAASIDMKAQSLAVRPFAGQQENTGKDLPDQSGILYSLPQSVRIEEIRIGEEVSRDETARCVIFFYPDGRSTGGQILFQNDRGRKLSLIVDRITGSAGIKEPGEGNLR